MTQEPGRFAPRSLTPSRAAAAAADVRNCFEVGPKSFVALVVSVSAFVGTVVAAAVEIMASSSAGTVAFAVTITLATLAALFTVRTTRELTHEFADMFDSYRELERVSREAGDSLTVSELADIEQRLYDLLEVEERLKADTADLYARYPLAFLAAGSDGALYTVPPGSTRSVDWVHPHWREHTRPLRRENQKAFDRYQAVKAGWKAEVAKLTEAAEEKLRIRAVEQQQRLLAVDADTSTARLNLRRALDRLPVAEDVAQRSLETREHLHTTTEAVRRALG